jgi:Na+/melibiose symporter-like transporter
MLQAILLAGAIIFTGRAWFISRIPTFEQHSEGTLGFKKGLLKVVENKSLTGFSIYLFVLNLAAYGTIPMMTIYLKNHLNAPDNIIVLISGTTLAGMLVGYLAANKIIKRWAVKGTLLWIHISYVLVNLILFFIYKGSIGTYIVIAILLFIYSFMAAVASIVASSEMMLLASAGNKTMAMAFCGAFYYGGCGFSRLISSLILGSGLLAPAWNLGAIVICHYQTLFLIYAVLISFAAAFLLIVPAIFPRGYIMSLELKASSNGDVLP